MILRSARDRSPGALGTVIDTDPHYDRDAIVEVLHEDGTRRWRHRRALRLLGMSTSQETLARDLVDLLGDEAPVWARRHKADAERQ